MRESQERIQPDLSDFGATLRHDLAAWSEAQAQHAWAVGSERIARWAGRALWAVVAASALLLALACAHVALAVALGGWSGWLAVAGLILLEAGTFWVLWRIALRDRWTLFLLNQMHSHGPQV